MGPVDFYNTLLSKFDSVKTKGYATNFKLLNYKQIKDSTNRITGYATLWKLTHKLDSIVNLMKFRNDSVALSGYFTNYAALSKVDKITGYSLIRNTLRDSVLTAEQHADTVRSQGHATIFDLKTDTATVGGHIRNYSNPHQVTKTQVGLSNVANIAQVTSVTGMAPIASSGGTTPAISLVQDANNRLVTDTEKATWNGKQNALVNPLVKADTATLVGTKYNLLQKIDLSQKAANNGVATLDAGGKVPFTQLPVSLLIYQGTWNPVSNTPTLQDGVGTTGYVYMASDSGTCYIGGQLTYFWPNDYIIYNGATWQRSGGTKTVRSVNGQQGVVTLTTDNVNEGATNKYYTDARSRGALSLTTTGTSGAATYNNSTGLFNIPNYTLAGLGGQPQLNGTGFVKASGTTISYDNSSYSLTTHNHDSNYEPLISKSTGFLKWNGTAWVWDANTYSTDIHSNITALNAVTGTNTGDQTLSGLGGVALADSVGGAAGKYTTGKAFLNHAALIAATGASGHLTSADWNTFNNKVSFPGFGTTHTLSAYGDHTHDYSASFAPISGSGNYIQNQSAIAQSADLWISRVGKFDGNLIANSNLYSSKADNDIVYAGSQVWLSGTTIGLRGGVDHSFNIDTYNAGSYTNTLKILQTGAATFASTVSATQFQSTVATGTPPLTVASTTMVSNLNADMLDGQHGSYYQPLLTNPTTGIGTINYVPKWTGTGTLGNSLIYDDGTNVGIETTNPVEKLDVNGDIAIKNRIYPRVAGTDIAISNRNGNILFNNTSGIEWARITSNGNFGFGITPLSKFHILGGIGNNLPIGFGGVDNYTVLLQDPTSSAIDVGGSICFAGYKTGTSATGLFGYIKGGKYNSTPGDERGYLSMGVSYNTNGAGMEVMRLNTDGNVKILSNIVSNSPSTGALTVAGGVGVGGSVNAKGLIAGEMASIDGSLLVFNATNDAFLQLGIDGSRGYFMSNYWSTAGPKPLDFFIAGTRIGNPVMTLNANTVTLPNLTASKLVFTDVSKNLTSTGIGTSSQFIKGDGSLDGTTYLSSLPAHAHGNITNTGYLGATATLPLITGTGGIIQAGAFGTTAGTFAAGDDSRVNNGQTAFGWGNHAGLYRPAVWVPAWSDVTSKPTTLSTIATNDLGNYGGFKLASDSTNAISGYTTLYQNSLKAAVNHTHSYLPLSGGTLTGALYGTSASFSSTITASDHILSDIRLKKNIQRLNRVDFLKVNDIRFIKYTMKTDSANTVRYGVSAQQVEKILPEVVYTDEKGTKSVAYIDLLVLIVAQQKQEIEALKKSVHELEKLVNK